MDTQKTDSFMNNVPNDMNTLDIMGILRHFLAHWYAIAISLLLCGAIAWGYTSYMVPETYSSNALIYVNISELSLGGTSFKISDFSDSVDLANRYTVALTSRRVLEKAIAEHGLTYSYEQLKRMVSVSAVNDTEFLSISVVATDPADAAEVANAVTDAVIEIMNTLVEGNHAIVLDTARMPKGSSGPNVKRNTVLGGIVGAVLCCAVLVLMYLMDSTVKGKDELTEKYSLPILSVIPDHAGGSSSHKYGYGYGYGYRHHSDKKKTDEAPATAKKNFCSGGISFVGQEAYKLLRTNVEFSFARSTEGDDGSNCGRFIGITSSSPNEFKSTTAVNLALSLADAHSKVLLLDCDLRKSELAKRLELDGTKGVSDYMIGDCRLNEIIHSGVQKPSLDVITCGTYPPNPSELLSSPRMTALVKELRKTYQFIIVDLPPLTEVADALVAGRFCDGMLVVVREQFANRNDLEQSVRKLDYAEINVLGFVMTGGTQHYGLKKYGKYGYYRYGYYKK